MSNNSRKGMFPITAGVALTERAHGIVVTGTGTITGTDSEGATFTAFPVVAGVVYDIIITSISAATATGIFGLKRRT